MKKKLIFILLALVAVVAVLSACGGDGDTETTECTHEWALKEGTVTSATCEAGGTDTFVCTLCQEEKTEAVESLGHDMQRTETVEATCVAGGCTRCEETEQRNETKIALNSHDFEEKRVEPTCTTRGSTETKCTLCGANDGSKKTLPQLGHTYTREYKDGEEDKTVVTTVKPTCTENGSITYKCGDCDDAEITKTYEELSAEGASDADKKLAATLKALGHDYSVLKEHVDAKCLTAGHTINSCKNGCGTTEKVASQDPLGHTYERAGAKDVKYAVDVEPTCITDGKEWAVCDDCAHNSKDDVVPNEKYSQVVPATGEHDYSFYLKTTSATCTSQGYDTYRCGKDPNCTAQQEMNHFGPLEHQWSLDEALISDGQPTCATQGNYPYYCEADYSKKEGLHVYCTMYSQESGNRMYNVNGEEVSEIKHVYTQGNYKIAPTCITPATYTCEECTKDFIAYAEDTDAQATGIHVYDFAEESDIVAPTCSTYGYTVYHCSSDTGCSETQNKDFTARTPHNLTEITSDGMTQCQDCTAKFINTTTKIATEFEDEDGNKISSGGTSLCRDPLCEGCDYDDILVSITASTAPEAAKDLAEVVDGETTKYVYEQAVDSENPITLLEIFGTPVTNYTIKVYSVYEGAGSENNVEITSFKANIAGEEVDVNLTINTETTEDDVLYVDLAEVAGSAVMIVIEADTNASVNFYKNN